MTKLVKYKEKTQEVFDEAINTLKKYLTLPTVSAHSAAIPDTVAFVSHQIEQSGGEVRVLDDCGGNPVVYGFFPAGEKGDNNKTLLFYNHYDVQPADPLEEWHSSPFEPTIRDGKIFARGVADNKGDFIARLTAIKVLQETEGGLPCNIKFMVEGEEEIGSPSLEAYLTKYASLFKADACIWEFGSKDQQDRVKMVAGIKGMAYLELTCTGADVDMHSSVGAYVDNAAWRLVQALGTMKNEHNDILVAGFFDDITPPTKEEIQAVQQLPFDEAAIQQLYGLKRPLITKAKNVDPREAMVFHPTMTICGLDSGYTGEGAKTVLPRKATAKVDCRLVPGQDPARILELVETHLKLHGYHDIEVKSINGQKAYRSNYSHPFVQHVVSSAQVAYGTEVFLAPNDAGTGPMFIFGELLGCPVVSTGVGWFESNAHAPNESIRLKDFEEGIVYMAHMLAGFAPALSANESAVASEQ